VHARTGDRFGQFIFPKEVLLKKGVISTDGIGGKRAIPVYAPWDQVDNKQAAKKQLWQREYFFEISTVRSVDNIISTHFESYSNI